MQYYFSDSKILLIMFLILTTTLFAQQSQSESRGDIIFPDERGGKEKYMPRGDQKYITTDDGMIRMFVNVWGEVKNPGTHMVSEDIDLLTLLSMCGGPTEGANLSRVKVYRKKTDSTQARIEKVNLDKFINKGTTEGVMTLKPNDTVIIPETMTHKILSNLGIISTTLQIVTLYFQIQYFNARAN